jgi:hypothetical protein
MNNFDKYTQKLKFSVMQISSHHSFEHSERLANAAIFHTTRCTNAHAHGKILDMQMFVGELLVHFGNKKQQQFNAPNSMPINFTNSVESVKLESLQVGEKLNEQ